MPKISPRPEVTETPLYRATMEAQHLAYQLMRDVPADRKSDAARVHVACVHATTYAQYALDPDVADKESNYRGVLESAGQARRLLEPLNSVTTEPDNAETLSNQLLEIEKIAEEALAPAPR